MRSTNIFAQHGNIPEKLWDMVFLIGLFLYSIASLIQLTVLTDSSTVDQISQLIRYFCYLLMILKIVNSRYTKGEIYFLIAVMALALISAYNSDNKALMFALLIVFAAKDVSSDSILKTSAVVHTLMLALLVICASLGIIQDYIYDPLTRQRHSLGFDYANTGSSLYLFILLCYFSLRKDKLTLLECIIMEGINIWFFHMTDTRFPFILITLSILIFYLMALHHRIKGTLQIPRFLRVLFILSPVVGSVLSLALQIGYSPYNSFLYRLNTLLSNRLSLGHAAIENFGVSWLGQQVTLIGWSRRSPALSISSAYNYVDCSYLQILLIYGIVMFCIVIGLYIWLTYRCARTNNYYLLIAIVIICLYSIIDDRLINISDVSFNPFTFLFFSTIQPEKQPQAIPSSVRFYRQPDYQSAQ